MLWDSTLNIMSLLALSLAIGLLIDDAIVVRENIVRHLRMGKSHRAAALEGTEEIGLAVLATTFSIVAVFLPVAVHGGHPRTVLPPVRGHGVGGGADLPVRGIHAGPDAVLGVVRSGFGPRGALGVLWRVIDLFDRGFEALGRGYGRLVRCSLRHRF
jgi:HAE1 family hydrophobic/amphiphilic exporter-1